MVRRFLVSSIILILLAGSLTAADKEIKSKWVSVDSAGKKVTVAVDGKHQEFSVDPKVAVTVSGTASKEGLKDKALKAGAEVTLTVSEKGTTVTKIAVGHHATSASGDKPKYEPRGPKVKIVKVDAEKNLISVTTEEGKKLDLKIDDNTKFFGPRGGVAEKGIKDDRVADGHEIHYWMSKDNKKVEEIHLAVRKSEKK